MGRGRAGTPAQARPFRPASTGSPTLPPENTTRERMATTLVRFELPPHRTRSCQRGPLATSSSILEDFDRAVCAQRASAPGENFTLVR